MFAVMKKDKYIYMDNSYGNTLATKNRKAKINHVNEIKTALFQSRLKQNSLRKQCNLPSMSKI